MSRRPHLFDATMENAASEGFAQGVLTERERVRQIFADDAAVGREGTAVFLATRTELPARAAEMFLATAPRADAPAFNVRPLRWPLIEYRLSIVGDQNEQN